MKRSHWKSGSYPVSSRKGRSQFVVRRARARAVPGVYSVRWSWSKYIDRAARAVVEQRVVVEDRDISRIVVGVEQFGELGDRGSGVGESGEPGDRCRPRGHVCDVDRELVERPWILHASSLRAGPATAPGGAARRARAHSEQPSAAGLAWPHGRPRTRTQHRTRPLDRHGAARARGHPRVPTARNWPPRRAPSPSCAPCCRLSR